MFTKEKMCSNLKQLRHDMGKTCAAMAQDLHVTDATVSRWENGTREPSIENLCMLADYFNLTIDELVGRR